MSRSYVVAGGHRLEVERLAARAEGLPTLVFLHDGLGSVSLWRDFPARIAAATSCGAVVFSRYGHGRSDPLGEPRTVRYMHDEAEFSLARLLAQMDVPEALLVGHSDGASISLLHAASNPDRVSGLVLLAPHVFVEDVSIAGIRASRTAYLAGDLRRRLAKYHRDPDATFFGWNDIWLSAEFRSWNIEDVLSRID
ncbi:MAG: alpha/beta fold hydrolase, partial [Actinomycetota bacterium]|nr:alpha/beta fold hydrolase [Actinomycetota bacterium]